MSKAFGWTAIAVMTVGLTTVVLARPTQVPAPPSPVTLGGAIVLSPTDVPGLVVVPPPVRLIDEDDVEPAEDSVETDAPAPPSYPVGSPVDPDDEPDDDPDDESDDDDSVEDD